MLPHSIVTFLHARLNLTLLMHFSQEFQKVRDYSNDVISYASERMVEIKLSRQTNEASDAGANTRELKRCTDMVRDMTNLLLKIDKAEVMANSANGDGTSGEALSTSNSRKVQNKDVQDPTITKHYPLNYYAKLEEATIRRAKNPYKPSNEYNTYRPKTVMHYADLDQSLFENDDDFYEAQDAHRTRLTQFFHEHGFENYKFGVIFKKDGSFRKIEEHETDLWLREKDRAEWEAMKAEEKEWEQDNFKGDYGEIPIDSESG